MERVIYQHFLTVLDKILYRLKLLASNVGIVYCRCYLMLVLSIVGIVCCWYGLMSILSNVGSVLMLVSNVAIF